MRPLCTIIKDTLSWYGVDEHGGRVHDLLGTRCDPYINTVLAGGDASYDYHCHSNLTRAVIPFGLNESDVHDVINLFQVTGLDNKGRYFMNPCPAQPGDHIEFLAEQDLLMALSKWYDIEYDQANNVQAPVQAGICHSGDSATTVNKRCSNVVDHSRLRCLDWKMSLTWPSMDGRRL